MSFSSECTKSWLSSNHSALCIRLTQHGTARACFNPIRCQYTRVCVRPETNRSTVNCIYIYIHTDRQETDIVSIDMCMKIHSSLIILNIVFYWWVNQCYTEQFINTNHRKAPNYHQYPPCTINTSCVNERRIIDHQRLLFSFCSLADIETIWILTFHSLTSNMCIRQ